VIVATKQKRTPFWWGVLDQAEKRKRIGLPAFTPGQKEKALDWETCAVGRQRLSEQLLQHYSDAPADPILEDLACDFYEAVEYDRPARATVVLRKIERRAAELEAHLKREAA
jgi:hypothetical protein